MLLEEDNKFSELINEIAYQPVYLLVDFLLTVTSTNARTKKTFQLKQIEIMY